jgi:hypothetical protein
MAAMACLMVSYAVQALYIRRRVEAVLAKSYAVTGQADTLELRSRLSAAQSVITRQASTQMVPYLVFAVVPMLYTKHDYGLPFSWLAIPIIALRIAKSSASHSGRTRAATGNSPVDLAYQHEILRGNTSSNSGRYR